jgi:4-amino-4-deoxy-L-arabinose transferase-like glycosyltransferase
MTTDVSAPAAPDLVVTAAPRPARRRVPRALVVLFLLGLALRAGFLAADPYPGELAGLARANGEIARNLVVHGEWFVLNRTSPNTSATYPGLVDPAAIDYRAADAGPSFKPYRIHMPGTALLLAGIWKVTGSQRYLPLQVLQVLVDAAMILVVHWIARTMYRRRRAALLAAAGYALFVPIAALIRIPFYDPWAITATMGIFALMLKARDAGRPLRWLLAAGLVTGFGMWFRAQLVLLPVALALAMLPALGWRRVVPRAVVPAALALLLVAPYSLWTLTDQGHFSPVNTGTGQVLWEGLGQRANDFGAVMDDGVTFEQVHAERPDLEYASYDYDRYLLDKAKAAIAGHPGFYAALLVQRAVLSVTPLMNSGELGRARADLRASDGSLLAYAKASPRQAAKTVAGVAAGPLMLLAALGGLWLTRRRRDETLLLLALLAATFAVPIVMAHAWRYVAPATFVYLVLGAQLADRGAVLLRRRRSRRAA